MDNPAQPVDLGLGVAFGLFQDFAMPECVAVGNNLATSLGADRFLAAEDPADVDHLGVFREACHIRVEVLGVGTVLVTVNCQGQFLRQNPGLPQGRE